MPNSAAACSSIPGAGFGFTQPIEMRVDELVAGVKADVAVLIYGDDLTKLGALGKDIERLLRQIPGAGDVKADYQANSPTMSVKVRQQQLARRLRKIGRVLAQQLHALLRLTQFQVCFGRDSRRAID